ncbi:MAG: TlpA disulfide reductase family protein [Elusimicrobia bacterium]|nr:TlpA disulfide reductase family protein [Elusimicrobiota bacterium]
MIKISNLKFQTPSYFKIILLASCFLLLVSCSIYSADLGIDVGNKALDFSLKELSSKSNFKLSNYTGKSPVFLSFFATWCKYCNDEVPELNKIYNEYSKKGLVVISVNVQEREEKVSSFVQKKKILYRILLDSSAEVSNKFKVYGIPTNMLIDSKGVIVFRGNDMPDVKEIEKILLKKKNKK